MQAQEQFGWPGVTLGDCAESIRKTWMPFVLIRSALVHRIFQTFIDRLSDSVDVDGLRGAMAEAATALDLPCFAYLSMPEQPGAESRLISTYPPAWTTYYLRRHYERLDPVITQALRHPEPFEWGLGAGTIAMSRSQQQLFEEAAHFGIRYGFTVPIHDGHGPIAAVTFATDDRHASFERCVQAYPRVLQLMALYFHAHARRKLVGDRLVGGVPLSPREFECLAWAARGKSTPDIGQILGISRRTAVFHLENAKAKLGVRSICQAVARFAESRPTIRKSP